MYGRWNWYTGSTSSDEKRHDTKGQSHYLIKFISLFENCHTKPSVITHHTQTIFARKLIIASFYRSWLFLEDCLLKDGMTRAVKLFKKAEREVQNREEEKLLSCPVCSSSFASCACIPLELLSDFMSSQSPAYLPNRPLVWQRPWIWQSCSGNISACQP